MIPNRKKSAAYLFTFLFIAACATTPDRDATDAVVISVVGTNDVHGELVSQEDRGGITTFSGYVAAIRQARADDGALLLLDAGDMWQGTLESNLSEGADVVRAYNELGYAAAAIGNHEFDFGPAGPRPIPSTEDDDPRGALKQRASEALFPLLAANLIDTSTGQPVAWENVKPSVMVNRAGVDIGLVGVMTKNALMTTIAANTVGLRVAPLAESIVAEAESLREKGADLVIVLAHAGGECTEFGEPADLSSCDMNDEIMRVAEEIPAGLVDYIIAGHEHRGIAHVVNGIAITASYSNTRAFSRVDFVIDPDRGAVIERRIFPPQPNVAASSYAGEPVKPMAAVVEIAQEARELATQLQERPVGVYLDTPMTLSGRPESVLGNLMTDAELQATGGDISIHNVHGGIRAELPAGNLTYGSVYRMFPFDNRIAVIELSGADVRRIIANQVHNTGRRAGFSGMRVFIECNDDRMSVRMLRPDGREIADTDELRVVVNDFLLLGGDGVLTPVIPAQGFEVPTSGPLVRDVLTKWFGSHAGRLNAAEFFDTKKRRWNLPDPLPDACTFAAP